MSVLVSAAVLATAASAQVAKPGDPGLTGTKSANTWKDFNSANYTSFPVDSLQGGSATAGGASLNLVSGGTFFASSSLYGGFSTPTNSLRLDVGPLAGANTLVFQIRIGEGIGDVTTAPTLAYTTSTGTSGTLSTAQQLVDRGSDTLGGMAVTLSLYKYQWNLSGLGNLTSLSIAYGSGGHSTTTNLRIDQGTQAVPEPASLAALTLGVTTLIRRRKR